ncbi:hypothetical protein AAC387_Pa11g1131 [Persea americana]
MSSSLSTWNNQSFENLFQEPSRLRNRIQGIQASTSYYMSQFLQSLEKELLNHHALKLQQVEIFFGPNVRG